MEIEYSSTCRLCLKQFYTLRITNTIGNLELKCDNIFVMGLFKTMHRNYSLNCKTINLCLELRLPYSLKPVKEDECPNFFSELFGIFLEQFGKISFKFQTTSVHFILYTVRLSCKIVDENHRFGGTHGLHLQGILLYVSVRVPASLAYIISRNDNSFFKS
jgi:hypothetical protein